MNGLTSALLLFGLLLLADPVAAPQDSAQREKVAEGEYSEWQDGHPLKDTGLAWTVWRTKDGLEIEATLPPDEFAFIFAALAGPGSRATPELKKEVQGSSATRSINLELTNQTVLQRMILDGVSLDDRKQVRVADCEARADEIACKGREGTIRVKSEDRLPLVYTYPFTFPLSFTPILKNNKPAGNQPARIKLAMLDDVKYKVRLTEVPGQLYAEGVEQLAIGEHTFETTRYLLVLATKTGERKIKLWTANHETVFAMEDSLLAPGVRILLTKYKRYSDF
jgi:hypothetical protein